MTKPILYDSHMHTPLCNHAVGMPREYAQVAHTRGLAGIIITCHNPIPDGYSANVRMQMHEMDVYVSMVEDARREWQTRLDVRLGIECDYAPGMEPWLEKFIPTAPFEYVLGSVHPQVAEYRERYFGGDEFAYQKTYFEHLALAAESGLFDALAHPDLVKNEAPCEWQFPRIAEDIQRALDRIAASGVAMELNTSGRLKRIPEINPSPTILRMMSERNIPVVLGSDAHVPSRAGDYFEDALHLLKISGYKEIHYFLNRKKNIIQIEDALKTISLIDGN